MLSVIEPLVCAEACFLLGDLDRCGHHLQHAASSMVGQPFIELDWRIEYMRARLAERLSDREGARHYLHRCLQVQDFLVRSLPAKQRDALLKHPRFQPLDGFRARLERFRLTRPTPGARGPGEHLGLIGSSAPMRTILETVRKLEDLDLPVLITGETGTGKELVARAVHKTGPRRRGPFFSLHCASLPPELFESELFGYEAGAFTGAEESRTGILEHLDGGTLLLDDITQLSSLTQAKLLQVLDTHVVRPLGSLDVKSVDVRFLASTNQDLDDDLQRGAFREDLFHRLRGAVVHLPPLRARPEDIPELTQHFFQKHGRRLDRAPPILTRNALDLFRTYPWPGNVRELESLIIRLIVTSTPGTALEPSRIRGFLTSRRPSLFPETLLEGRDLKELRRELDRAYLVKLFHSCDGDIPAMARTLDMKRSNLYTWMRKVGIDVRSLRGNE